MATNRPFAYNPTHTSVAGTYNIGDLAVGVTEQNYNTNPGGLIWWGSPDEEQGYVIAVPISGNTQPTPLFSGAPSGQLTLSPTYIGNSMNLSNGNQTVHQFFGYVQSVLGQTLINGNDKVMFSVFCSLDAPATFPNGHFVGIGTTSMNYNGVVPDPYNSYPGNDNQSIGLNSGGEYWYNGSIQASGLPTWTSGDTIDVAVSLINNKIWIRVNGGNWNNIPTDNPATGTGGQGVLGGLTSFYPVLCPSYEGTMTILNNTTYGVPEGFSFLGSNINASVKFLGTKVYPNPFSDSTFISLTNQYFNQSFTAGSEASVWLTTNGFWNSYPCLGIATNDSGGLTGWGLGALSVAYNPTLISTYPVGSTITWQDGSTATIVGYDPYAPNYIDIFWDIPKTGTLFPITLCAQPPIGTVTPTPTPTITPTPTLTPSNSFTSIWRTTSPSESITLPYSSSGTYSGTIDWGDGNTSANSYANQTHTYTSAGDYTVTIDGTIEKFNFGYYGGSSTKIIEILQWGNISIGSDPYHFYYCPNLVLTGVTGTLNLTGVNDLTAMFFYCTSLTTINNIESWDVSNVTNMSNMFFLTSFNQNISGWDVRNVTNMNGMFSNNPQFNQPIGTWVVSGVTNMANMFQTSTFNQDISGWDVSNVISMSQMFNNTPFDYPLSGWNVSNVTDMSAMFQGSGFNQPIGNWIVSGVTNMGSMFGNTLFNQPLSGWNVSNVTNMANMFSGNYSFNQDIGGWNVSEVTDMNAMFLSTPFNYPLSGWNVSKVINMSAMFYGAQDFNQDIGNWNISGVTNFINFMSTKSPATFSTTNLDSIYNGWSTKNPKTNKSISFGGAKHTSASSAGRAVLTGTYGWTITDGGI